MGLKYFISKNSYKLCTDKCIYLCNHKSWCDILSDVYLCENPISISRYLVVVIFPVLFIGSYISDNVRFIYKNKNVIEQFTKVMNSIYKSNYYRNVIIYPEGARYPNSVVNPLKKGSLIYSYENDIPIQLIISKNKEKAVNEKNFSAKLGVSIYTHISEPIYPKDYDNLNDYIKHVTSRWNDICTNVYNSPIENFQLYQSNHKTHKLAISEYVRYSILIVLCSFIYVTIK